mgnify:CR=1 FL=1
MSSTDKITIADACELLGVSRPTFDAHRKRFKFKEIREGWQVFFSRSEILSKISPKVSVTTSLIITDDSTVSELLLDDVTFDLRKIKYIDPHGVLSLLCSVLSKANEGKHIRLLVEDSFQIQRLHSLGFFLELERDHRDAITWDKSKVTGLRTIDPDMFLPIQYIGHKGGERQISEDLVRLLIRHGFSEEIGARIGWIFGELADNALTHSKGPCYLMCHRFIAAKKGNFNFLVIAVADMGVGIHNSLRTNSKYASLDNKTALLTAFKSNVSSWADEFKRGKGLTDVIAISMGNYSYFRVESGDMGLVLPWDSAAKWCRPMSSVSGTRYSIVLTDGEFKDVSREDADKYIENLLRTL